MPKPTLHQRLLFLRETLEAIKRSPNPKKPESKIARAWLKQTTRARIDELENIFIHNNLCFSKLESGEKEN